MYKFCIKTGVLYPKMYIWTRKTKKKLLFTLKMKFLPKNFTKMYKFWIKTVVLYPKMYIWSRKNKKIVIFTLKMKFLQKNFVKMYKFWIKTVALYPKMYILSWKTKQFVLFTLKMKFLPKKSHQNIQILDKNWSFVPKNVHLVLKKQKNCTFYTENEVFAKFKFTKMYKFWIKTVVMYPKMYIWSRKNKKIVLFILKMKFLQKKNH